MILDFIGSFGGFVVFGFRFVAVDVVWFVG